MGKPNTSRTGRRRIAGERTVRSPGTKLSLVPPTDGRAEAAGDHVPVETPAVAVAPDPAERVDEVPPRPDERAGEARPRPAGPGPSNLVLAGLAVLAAAVVAAAAYFAVPAWHARGVEQAQAAAPSVAERAAKAILSYDYRSLDHDETAAAGYMTPSYRKKYEHTFSAVKAHAPGLKAKVTAQVLGSGISEADADHAHVLLFVDQTTNSRANPGQPQIALNRVMLDMVRQGGTWLVNGIASY